MIRIIYVHGISDAVIEYDYSEKMTVKIKRQLVEKGVVKSINEIDKFISFENVNYSSIGFEQEQDLLYAYKKDSKRHYNFLDNVLEQSIYFQIRRELITSVSDVLIYQSDYWKEVIRKSLEEKIEQYVDSGDEVSIVGHSLGSVVSFDTLYFNATDNTKWKKNNFKVKNLFTLGSPIALFSLQLDQNTGSRVKRFIPAFKEILGINPRGRTNIELVSETGAWLNFFDAQDPIGFPLETLFKGKFDVKDYLVQTGTLPLTAHTEYWSNKLVTDKITDALIGKYDEQI